MHHSHALIFILSFLFHYVRTYVRILSIRGFVSWCFVARGIVRQVTRCHSCQGQCWALRVRNLRIRYPGGGHNHQTRPRTSHSGTPLCTHSKRLYVTSTVVSPEKVIRLGTRCIATRTSRSLVLSAVNANIQRTKQWHDA